MQFSTIVTVSGAQPQDTTVEGKAYNSTKVYVMTELKQGLGHATVEYKWGDASNYEKLKNKQFPFQAEALMEIVTNGKSTSTIMLELKPITTKQG